MLLSAVSVLVVAQSSSEIPEGLMNNPVCKIMPANVYSMIIDTAMIGALLPTLKRYFLHLQGNLLSISVPVPW